MDSNKTAELAAPKSFLIGACGLIISSLALSMLARQTDIGATRMPPQSATATIDLRFEDRANGDIAVVDADSNRLIKLVEPGNDGFVRVALRSLAFERRARGDTRDQPFRLGLRPEGGYWLEDLATGRVLHLDAYGRQNAQGFAQFLELGRIVK